MYENLTFKKGKEDLNEGEKLIVYIAPYCAKIYEKKTKQNKEKQITFLTFHNQILLRFVRK